MPENVRRGNATNPKVRARVEHVFGHQKAKMGLFVRTIGIARAAAKITLANLAFNMHRLIFLRNPRKSQKISQYREVEAEITPVDSPHQPNPLRS